MGGDDISRDKNNPWQSSSRPHQEEADDIKLWGVFLFGLIGATATTFAVGQLRRTVEWFNAEKSNLVVTLYNYMLPVLKGLFIIKPSSATNKLKRSQSSWKGGTGSSFRSTFQEEAWKRYNRRMQEEYEEEMERIERIRRMQSVFNRERNKYKRSYESWRENDPGAHHQQFQRDDWYWKTDSSFRDQRTNFRTPRESASSLLSHHYTVLGLDRSRKTPYTEAEIKKAFRAKAKEFHPDQNQDNKVIAEAKFKEVMISYEAIKQERKDTKL